MCISRVIHDNTAAYKWKNTLYTIEQTTRGIHKFGKARLLYPVVNLAETNLKRELGNYMATQEFILSLLVIRESLTLSGKSVLVLGMAQWVAAYGHCAPRMGVSLQLQKRTLRHAVAASRGYRTIHAQDIDTILLYQDVIISCTQNSHGDTPGLDQIMLMNHNSIIINAGIETGEISQDALIPGTYKRNGATITKNDDSCVLCNFEKMGSMSSRV